MNRLTDAELRKLMAPPAVEGGPREYKVEEVREQVLKHLWGIIGYWETVQPLCPGDPPMDLRYRLSGLMHSTLAMLDGCTIPLPGFAITPVPHKDDAEYHQKEGENWYPREENVKYDIGGGLNDEFFNYDPKNKKA